MKAEVYKINKLAKLMIEVVYPEFIETLKHIGLNEALIKLEGYHERYITNRGGINYIDDDENLNNYYENILEFDYDPLLEKIIEIEEEDEDSAYASPVDAYYAWCNAVMDTMTNLKEEHYTKIDEIINRINVIPVVYTRKVLTEKNKN